MKKTFVFILTLLLAGNIFAYEGSLSGESELSVLKSQWFDIIYPPASETSARILYDRADAVYEELTGNYGLTPQFRMPVVLTPAVEDFNAYWTNYPYNHIVVYDTGTIEELAVFSETLLSTFTHELVHAITYNMRSPFWKKVGKVFGDAINPVGFTITSGWAEGATVSTESLKGEGRLNDEYAMQMVKQAKIEGEFPHYADVQGASDLYPRGSFYYFNGAFADWLQKKYGLIKYGQFWYKCVNLQVITAEQAFKKTFGIKLYDAWKQFEEDYAIPQLVEVQQQDLCDNDAGSLYESLSASQKGIAYLDGKTNTAYFIPADKLGKDKKSERLFSRNYLESIKLSADGNYLAVDLVSDLTPTYKKSVEIYSLNNRKWYSIGESGLKEGTIVQSNGKNYLVCQKFVSQQNSIYIYDIDGLLKKGGNKATKIAEVKMNLEELPYSFTDLGNGDFAFIKKSGLDYSIVQMNLKGEVQKEYKAPKDRMAIRYLSFDGESLLFSWTEPGSLPRLGLLEDETFYLQSADFSGGVYWPVCVNNEIAYIGSFYRSNKLFAGSIEVDEELAGEEVSSIENAFTSDVKADENKIYPAQAYNPFDYVTRGLFFPFSSLMTNSYNPGAEGSYGLPIGITYATSDPWDGNIYQLSAGYGLNTNSFGLSAGCSGGSYTYLFKYSLLGFVEFDRYFWKQAAGEAGIGVAIPDERLGYFVFDDQAKIHYGRSNLAPIDGLLINGGNAQSDDRTNYFYGKNSGSVSYTNITKFGPARFEKVGFQVTASVDYEYNADGLGAAANVFANNANLSLFSIFYIPRLVPVNNSGRFTYNLPTSVSFALFNPAPILYVKNKDGVDGEIIDYATSYNLPMQLLAKAEFETVLFAYEVQKSVPVIRYAFLNDVYVSALYSIGFDYDQSMYGRNWQFLYVKDYWDGISEGNLPFSSYFALKTSVALTPNFGGAADASRKMYLCAKFIFEDFKYKFFDVGIDIPF